MVGCNFWQNDHDALSKRRNSWILSKLFDDESEIDPENTTRTKKLLDGVKGEESKDRTRISIDIQDLHIT